MKRIIQLVLIISLIIIMIVFYKTYFKEVKKTEIKETLDEKQFLNIDDQKHVVDGNNLIKNLKYNVTFDNDKEYIINSDLSEITYEDNAEIIKMKNVTAIFLDESIFPITVTANKAMYNNSTYDTYFSENVKVSYMDNVILSDKIDLNFRENIIKIYENVEYEGDQGTLKSDNIKINLITKNIQIYMDDKENKVEISTR